MKSISSLVDSLMTVFEFEKLTPRKQALNFWISIVGDDLSSMCSVEGFSESTLKVRAFNPGAAMELNYRSSEIISALNISAGADLFDSLNVILRPPRGRER